MNGIICINKPKGWTSFDVVNKISKTFRTKVGHTGTLDPQATGVLVCLVGATKVLPFLDMSTKRYRATCQFGLKTDTGDIWGNVVETQEIKTVKKEDLVLVLNSFIGKQTQRVPMTSAKKVKGKKLIDYQRQNIEIEQQYHEIEIFDIQLIDVLDNGFVFDAFVSSGTYIRSLCEDIAEKCHQLGTMSELVRTQAGPFSLSDCVELENFKESKLMDLEEGLKHYPVLEVEDKMSIFAGKKIQHDYMGEQIRVKSQGELLAIYHYDHQNKEYRSQRGLWI